MKRLYRTIFPCFPAKLICLKGSSCSACGFKDHGSGLKNVGGLGRSKI